MSLRLFQSLLYKSAQIQTMIEQEYRRKLPDQFRLIKLKKIRLVIKDRLERLAERERARYLTPIRVGASGRARR